MKKIIAMLALISVMLTGCGAEKQPEETLINSVTESTSEAAVTTEATTAETETESVTTIVTEPVTEKETTAVTEQEQEKELFRMVYTGDCLRFFSLENGIICAQSEQLNFVNADTGEFIVSISIPDDFGSVDKVVKGSGDVLAKVICDNYDYSTTPPTYYADALIVKDNYIYETIRKCEPADISFEACGHNIAEWALDIVDTDSGEVIVPGYRKDDDEYGFYTQWNEYLFDIDENCFVYRIGGYESLPGFGIYDFSTGTATTVPESRDLIPIGYRDGKIYSKLSAWDGYSRAVYVTDLETLETELLMEIPFECQRNEWIDYLMPSDGDYIIVHRNTYKDENGNKYPAQLYKADPDNGEAKLIYEFSDDYMYTDGAFIVDDDTLGVGYRKEDSIILIDMEQMGTD